MERLYYNFSLEQSIILENALNGYFVTCYTQMRDGESKALFLRELADLQAALAAGISKQLEE